MEVATSLDGLRATITGWKRAGLRVGFVPTMGNLHRGHQSLVRLVRAHADRVVVSIFVNPTQFGPGEDFTRYPRTPDADAECLRDAGCDLLWLPSVAAMYPSGVDAMVQIRVPLVTDSLEGAHRPGHFDGVATVVSRLFNQVQPDVAVFGRKDYQQLAVIRYMVRDLSIPVTLLAGETVREPDGLALSSRNQYLSAADRPVAAVIRRTLEHMRSDSVSGYTREDVENAARARLEASGFRVDYAVLRDPDLRVPDASSAGRRVALIAARLGGTRLIDNLEFDTR